MGKHIISIKDFQEPGEIDHILASSFGQNSNKKLIVYTKITAPQGVRFVVKSGEIETNTYTLTNAIELYNNLP